MKKDFDYYNTVPLPYPNKADFTVVYVYSAGKVIFQGSVPDYDRYISTHGKTPTVERVIDEAAFRAACRAYGVEQARLSEEFFNDLCEEHGVVGHPKASKVYSLAYDHGHASGHREIALYFDEFVDLIKD